MRKRIKGEVETSRYPQGVVLRQPMRPGVVQHKEIRRQFVEGSCLWLS